MGDSSALSSFNERHFAKRSFEPRESRLSKALESFESLPRRGRLLDVAAGSGLAAEELSGQGWTVTALEISAELCEQLRERGVANVHRHDLAAGPLPFAEGSFEAVFAGEIIEHLVDTGAFVEELARVLAPGGNVVITTPNLASFENRLRLLLGRYPRWLEWELPSPRARAYHDQGHVRGYTVPTLRSQLGEHGFVVERILGNWVPFAPQKVMNDLIWPPIARTGDWMPRFAQGLIVRARRST